MPLTLTILSAAVPAERRGLALGAWGGISGLAVAFGPLVGGAVVSGISWHWIFWLNVPIGLVLIPLALLRLDESRGPVGRLDLPGLALASAACSGSSGASSAATRSAGARRRSSARSLGGVVADRPRSSPGSCARRRRCCRCASSATARSRSRTPRRCSSSFGMFGSIFLLAQFFQTVQGYSPLAVRPADPAVDGDADDRRPDRRRALRPDRRAPADGRGPRAAGARPRLDRGGLDRRRRRTSSSSRPFAISGVGMALFFAPVANVVLSSVRAGRGGPGLGREQRDPRARRRLRRRGAGVGLRARRRLRRRRQRSSTAWCRPSGSAPRSSLLGSVAAFAIRRSRRRRRGGAELELRSASRVEALAA